MPAGAEDLQRGFSGGIAAADDDDALAVVGVRFLVVVMDVREILAGHVQQIRKIVVARRQHDVARMTGASHAAR